MIAALFLCLVPSPSVPLVPVLSLPQEDAAAELEAKIAAAGDDAEKLLELAAALKESGESKAAKTVFKKVVEVDPSNKKARKALRHHFYDEQWFESYAALSKYRRAETAKMKDKGLARWNNEWVSEGDVPYLNMGWTKEEGGKWSNPVDAERAKQIAEWEEAGYKFRTDDSSWIAPDDMGNWEQVLWKCGEEWVDMAKANEFHAELGQWWMLEGQYFSVWTTCDWDGGNSARWYADQVVPDMVRLFGGGLIKADKKPHFVVLNSLDQYNVAAGGNPNGGGGLVLGESEGISSLHGAYFADVFFNPTVQPPQYLGCGVSYWDRKDDVLKAWGPFWLRWAAAQSYIEAMDPSWLAVSEVVASAGGGGQPNPGAFWNEKKIPRWLRYGAASYAERFSKDPEVSDGGNPWALREFAFGQLKEGGSMHKVEDILAFELDLNDIDTSSRLYHEAGLVVSFLLDGADGDKKLRQKHAAFKAALKAALKGVEKKKGGAQKDLEKAVAALEKELGKNERDIKRFAGL
jgi:hypothetical protein